MIVSLLAAIDISRSSRRRQLGQTAALVSCLVLGSCSKPATSTAENAPGEPALEKSEVVESAAAEGPAAPGEPAMAAVGQPAPDFSLPDLDGKNVSLSALRGKTVVLEWFNPGCPFVRASHTVGSLVGMADKYAADGVVWMAINSGGAGKQGHGVDTNRGAATQFGMKYPVLVDESGQVGKAYGAERTPHLYVINPEGVLVYRGAIDNSPDGEKQSPEGGKLVNYVDNALAAVKTGTAVEPAETKPYGCSVKYKDL